MKKTQMIILSAVLLISTDQTSASVAQRTPIRKTESKPTFYTRFKENLNEQMTPDQLPTGETKAPLSTLQKIGNTAYTGLQIAYHTPGALARTVSSEYTGNLITGKPRRTSKAKSDQLIPATKQLITPEPTKQLITPKPTKEPIDISNIKNLTLKELLTLQKLQTLQDNHLSQSTPKTLDFTKTTIDLAINLELAKQKDPNYLNNLTKKNNELTDSIRKKSDEIEKLNTKYHEQENKRQEILQKVPKDTTSQKTILDKINSLPEPLSEVNQNLSEVNQKISEVNQKIKYLNEEKASLTNEQKIILKKIDEWNSPEQLTFRKQKQEEIDRQTELEQTQKIAEQTRKKEAQEQNPKNIRVLKLNAEITLQKKLIDSIQNNIRTLETDPNKKTELTNYQKRLTAAKTQLDKLNKDLNGIPTAQATA